MSLYGFSPIFPLIADVHGPYSMHTELADNITQNVKFILLTNPGERVMDPNFGVGLRHFLFEPSTPATISRINNKISEQFKRHLSFLDLKSAVISNPDENLLSVAVTYFVKPLSYEERLQLFYLTNGIVYQYTDASRSVKGSFSPTPGPRNLVPN
jgi:phage baseplate assembly protein W